MLNSYKELNVWNKSIQLVKEIYKLTEAFPKSEQYGLTNQMRRAAVSIPSNIAEGYTRKHKSGAELETQLTIAKELKMAPSDEFNKVEQLLSEVMKMLNKLSATLVAKP